MLSCRLRSVTILAATLLGFGGLVVAAPARTANPRQDNQAPAPPATENAWPKLSEEEQTAAVKDLKKYADDAASKLQRPLFGFETRYFLFFSDLAPKEAQNWAGLLDRMYARLAEMFAVPRNQNIWRGKALVFVFSKVGDYRKFEREITHSDAGSTAGRCHMASNGTVMIAFYRQEDALEFAHVLVHESVHGFLHRYRTPVFVPSWANEGLAETIATDLVPQSGRRSQVHSRAREGLQQHGSQMGDFFDADRLDAWQYPVAEMLCTFMITAGKSNYVDFINGIKDGLSWRESLEQKFKAPLDRLVPIFGQWLGVRNLQA